VTLFVGNGQATAVGLEDVSQADDWVKRFWLYVLKQDSGAVVLGRKIGMLKAQLQGDSECGAIRSARSEKMPCMVDCLSTWEVDSLIEIFCSIE